MRYDYDFNTMWTVKSLIKDALEAVEKHCEKDDDGDYIVLIGNENGDHIRTWIKPDELECLKEFVQDIN